MVYILFRSNLSDPFGLLPPLPKSPVLYVMNGSSGVMGHSFPFQLLAQTISGESQTEVLFCSPLLYTHKHAKDEQSSEVLCSVKYNRNKVCICQSLTPPFFLKKNSFDVIWESSSQINLDVRQKHGLSPTNRIVQGLKKGKDFPASLLFPQLM